jgi:hypothetical protein
MRFSLFPLLGLIACGPIQLDKGNEGEDTGKVGDTGDTGGDTVDTAAGLRPEVLSIEVAVCELNTDGEPTWGISLNCDDPQGAETLGIGYAQLSVDAILEDETHPMICVEGQCSVGWSLPDETACPAKGDGVTVVLVCIDKEGYESFPYEYPW